MNLNLTGLKHLNWARKLLNAESFKHFILVSKVIYTYMSNHAILLNFYMIRWKKKLFLDRTDD